MEDNELIVVDENKKFMDIIENVREDIRDNPYIEETMRVLSVEGYRSAIGCFWNAVVDDLRNKILYRSINLFNKEMKPRKEIKTYEDFQDNVNDEMLLDGAYKIGIIGWEAHKVLKQAKETRNIFDGHPRSSNPTAIKALSLIEDCIKYVKHLITSGMLDLRTFHLVNPPFLLEQTYICCLLGNGIYQNDHNKVNHIYKKTNCRCIGKLSASKSDCVYIYTQNIGCRNVSRCLQNQYLVRIAA